jgi:integrase
VREWAGKLTEQGLAPATVQKAYQILSKVMRSAVDAGLIAKTPCTGIPLPKVERFEMRFLTPGQVTALAEATDERYRALVLLAAYGGLRWAELVGLKVDKIDPLRSTVQVAETLVEVEGRFMPAGPPKTRAGRRTLTIPRPVMQPLVEHIARYCEPGGYVFTAPDGGPLRKNFRNRVWLPAIRKAGVAPLRFHDLRHTAVSFWIAAGAHVKEICALAGHSSAAVVLDRYGHILPASQEQLSA